MEALTQIIIELAFAVLSAFGSYAIWRLNNWLQLKKDSEVRLVLNDVLEKALSYGRNKALILAKDKIDDLVAHNDILEHAVTYAVNHAPQSLQHFDITPEKLKNMLIARLTGE